MPGYRLALLALAAATLVTSVQAQPATAPGAPVPATASTQQPADDAAREWQMTLHNRLRREARARPDWPEGRHEIVMGFRVARDGSISDPTLIVGTGHPEIDEQPAILVRRVGRMPPFPDSMAGESRDFRIPMVFDLRASESPIDFLPQNRFHVDYHLGWSITVPATFSVLHARERPGFVSVLSVGSHAQGPRPLPGSSRLCDVALRKQRADLAERHQTQLNAGAHQEQIARTLTAGYADSASTTSPDIVTFGRDVRGQEIVVTPADAPDARRYVALADPPRYRLAVTCGTLAEDIDQALPLFRALANRLVVDSR